MMFQHAFEQVASSKKNKAGKHDWESEIIKSDVRRNMSGTPFGSGPEIRGGKLFDPWGTPYHIEDAGNENITITSAGPNRSFKDFLNNDNIVCRFNLNTSSGNQNK
jgi:hypothetical protein